MTQSKTAVAIIRIAQGLVEGMLYPCCHGIMSKWAPPLERSRLATLALAGSYAGAVIGPMISGYLTEYVSWALPFYTFSLLAIIWYVVWDNSVFDTPLKDPFIDSREAEYICAAIGKSTHKLKITSLRDIPWRTFFTSLPVWAIIVANFCRSWTFYLFTIHAASFFEEVYDVGVATAATYVAIPHLIMAIIVPFGGICADYLREHKYLSTTEMVGPDK